MDIKTKIKPFNADTFSPVGIYLGLRDHYRKPCLLESNSFYDRSNSKSLIGLNPLAEISLDADQVKLSIKGKKTEIFKLNSGNFQSQISELIQGFAFKNLHFTNGFFTYSSFELSHLLEKKVQTKKDKNELPLMHLILFQYIIVLDHFKDEGEIVENTFDEFPDDFDDILHKINFRSYPDFPFDTVGEEQFDVDENTFRENVDKGKKHCIRGDVFQLVLSRRFKQAFSGEDFEVYRQLRRTNPSPYLFYFDFETHRLFGSSPEAQLVIHDGKAEIHPIAGTVKKSGNPSEDEEQTQFLIHDEKENAEHMMLVDLARNDLSKHCSEVKIDRLKEVQQFSHVIHLVSKITGKQENSSHLGLYLDTFPAGTLSGTPKPKALELIADYEPYARGFYGGGIGFIGAHGDLNMAIIIRSILSKNNVLHYQAGAGIVLDSIKESELKEVDNKLNALRTAIKLCKHETIS